MVEHQLSITHIDELMSLISRQIDHLQQVEDSVFQEWHFRSHQVVKSTSLDHALQLVRILLDLDIFALSVDVVQQIVEDVTNHVDLLLRMNAVFGVSSGSRLSILVLSQLFQSLDLTNDLILHGIEMLLQCILHSYVRSIVLLRWIILSSVLTVISSVALTMSTMIHPSLNFIP